MAGIVKALYNKDDIYIDNLERWTAISLHSKNKKVVMITVYRILVASDQGVYTSIA